MIQKFQYIEILKGLLAFTPFLLYVTSLSDGVSLGMLVFTFILFLSPSLYIFRKLIPTKQRFALILIISVSYLLLVRMILNAEVYSLLDKVGLFLPLILINSFILSVNESVLTMTDFKTVMNQVLSIGIVILLFFVIIGFLLESLVEFYIFSSPAGCFFLLGFLFSVINYFSIKKKESAIIE
jgi:H+/Na+-translocating ferredoxin:NAD+ oxidoreductase subunit E